jgi:hypothetical protein
VHKASYEGETGPALSENLNKHLITVWKKGKDPSKLKEQYEKHPIPSGSIFHKVSLNGEVSDPLQKRHGCVIGRDNWLKAIQGLIARAAVPIAKILDDLMEDKLDAQTAINHGLAGIILLSSVNNQLNQSRREQVPPFLSDRMDFAVCKSRREN